MQIDKNRHNWRDEVYDLLCGMTGKEVLHLMTDYHGMQLLDGGFIEHLDSEGIIELVEDEDEDEEDDNEN